MFEGIEGSGAFPCKRCQRREWVNWLATFPWTHFETLTFQEPRATARSAFGCLRAHRSRLSRRGMEARFFAVIEGGGTATRLHLHALSILRWADGRACARALLQDPSALHRAAWREWKDHYGRARISPLEGGGAGAVRYVAKYVTKEDSERIFLPSGGWERYLRA